MKLIIIAALNNNRVIGKNGKIPWHIPEDMQRFKMLTTGHTVLMGRKTFESIGSPLSHRRNIVISRNRSYVAPSVTFSAQTSVEIFHTIDTAFSTALPDEKVFIIGGGEIFQQTITLADEMMLTVVDNDAEGDTFFPEYERMIDTHFIEEYHTSNSDHRFYHYIKA
ncbi:MAG: dihydrofolate reductase [Bacteroidota bacterium]